MKNVLFLLLALSLSHLCYPQGIDSNQSKKSEAQIHELENRIKEHKKNNNKVVIRGGQKVYPYFPKVEFDFSNPDDISIPNKLKEGDFYQVEVTGINLNQYSVVLENSDTIYSTPLEFPTFGTLDLSKLKDLAAGSLQYLETINKEQKEDSVQDTEKVNMNEKEKVADSIKAYMKDLIKQISSYTTSLEDISELIEDKRYHYMAARVLAFASKDNAEWSFNIKKDLKFYDSLRTVLNTQNDNIEKAIKQYSDFLDTPKVQAYMNIKDDAAHIKVSDELRKLEEPLLEVKKQTNKLIKLISVDNMEKQLISVINLDQSFTYTSMPIQFQGESAEVKMKFIPKDSASGLQPYYLSPIKIGQPSFYWSVGPALYYSWLSSARVGYEVNQINDSTQRYSLVNVEDLQNEMGAAMLLRAGAKFYKNVGGHISVGTGLSLGEEVKPRMLLGGGFTLGNRHNLSVDFGAIGGYVDKVRANTDYEKVYVEKPDVLINDLVINGFLSIGYTFILK